MNAPEPIIIGIDAGGTKTTAWIAALGDPSATPLGSGHAGPGNPAGVGFDKAQEEILTAVAFAFEDAGIAQKRVLALCICAAGAGRSAEQNRLKTWAASHQLAERVSVTGDAEPILAAAASDKTGIALICGTGSLAWGRNAAGVIDRTGGWGPLFGDEGSAYAIALAGLRAASMAADGRSPATLLLEAFQQRLDAATPSALIQRIYGGALSRSQIAGCADVVFGAAKNDAMAAAILSTASAELAIMVTTLASKLSLSLNELRLGLAGGVLLHQTEFRNQVVSKSGASAQLTTLVPEPVAGAVKMARGLACS